MQHLQSKKHQIEELNENSKKKEGNEEIISENKPKAEIVTTLQDLAICLFCNEKLSTVQE